MLPPKPQILQLKKPVFTPFEKFKPLPKLKYNDKILLLTHTDIDGSGASVLLKTIFPRVDVEYCTNGYMSKKIKETLLQPEIASQYQLIIACDISCNLYDAELINKSPYRKKFILLDHHDTALELNQYPWAVVMSHITPDNTRAKYYDNPNNGHSSGTSLLYDYLHQTGHAERFQNQELTLQFVHTITGYDTWDWVNCFHSDPIFNHMNLLFYGYGSEIFEERWINRLKTDKNSKLFTDTDHFILTIEQNKIKHHQERIKRNLITGNILFKNEPDRYYSVVFCASDSYLSATFDLMKELYPNYDLYITETNKSFSVRTSKDHIHIGHLLKEMGGGGHQGAGGIPIRLSQKQNLLENVLNASVYFDTKQ